MKSARSVSPSLTTKFVKAVVGDILSGRIPVGARLPNERDMAKKMNVSRAVINGGITQLARMGFVDVVPRQGIFAADYRRRGTVESLHAIFEYNGGSLDPGMLKAIFEMRENLEVHIIRLAARRRTAQDIARLRSQIKLLEKSSDLSSLATETFVFYQHLARASGNVLYPMLINSNRSIYEPVLRVVYRHAPKKIRLQMMRQLVDCIETGKEDEAAESGYALNRWSLTVLETQSPSGEAGAFHAVPGTADLVD